MATNEGEAAAAPACPLLATGLKDLGLIATQLELQVRCAWHDGSATCLCRQYAACRRPCLVVAAWPFLPPCSLQHCCICRARDTAASLLGSSAASKGKHPA